jgi:hypothetical protein
MDSPDEMADNLHWHRKNYCPVLLGTEKKMIKEISINGTFLALIPLTNTYIPRDLINSEPAGFYGYLLIYLIVDKVCKKRS